MPLEKTALSNPGEMSPAVIAALSALLGDRLDTRPSMRAQFARGESFPHSFAPDVVAFPANAEEVSAIAAICSEHRTPMIPSGAGTSLEGHITAPHGGVAVNFARMDQILEVDAANLDCRVQPGVTREQLNLHLRDMGLFFPVDPGANATLGGMASTRASGTNAVRYGTMAHNILGLTVVQPDGTMIRTGGRARKSAAGYDLTRLYVGSEGTLGHFVEIRLRLHAIPEAIVAATCAFESLAGAVQTVTELIQLSVPVARVEFLDEVQIKACNRFSGLALPETPHLFFEFHGSPASAEEAVQAAADIAAANGGSGFGRAKTSEERSRLWAARHNAYFATVALRSGAEVWVSDVCVPISQLADAVLAAREDIDRHGLTAPIVGHVGDGNFHVLFCIDPSDEGERSTAAGVYERMIDRAIEAGGTCTGEHGIGMVKRANLLAEHGPSAVATMRAIKQALDPLGLMNPGKIFF